LETLPLRTRFREEMNRQITKDSLHHRNGLKSFLLELGGVAVGFSGVAIEGPWKDRPTVVEFYVRPDPARRWAMVGHAANGGWREEGDQGRRA